jgi:hypothetical protein
MHLIVHIYIGLNIITILSNIFVSFKLLTAEFSRKDLSECRKLSSQFRGE